MLFKKISIVGVGLIGGSIGLAVKKKRLAREVIGIGRRAVSLRKAIRKGAIDKATLDLKEGVRDADLVVIATPVGLVMPKIKEVSRCLKKGAILIDVNSTKEKIVRYADKIIPEGVYFVGTHPIAGSEETGVSNSSGNMFKETLCIITPTRYTDKKALSKVKRLWEKLGAKTEILSPSSHDRIVANISHLPHLLAYNLCTVISCKDLKLAGSGFRDTTRVAKSSADMWADIFLQNSKNLLRSIEDFKKGLGSLKDNIRRNRRNNLIKKLALARARRYKIG